ncbi:hypothetical protein QR680_019286 [Steinernema hermaphroditum]|uniref:Aspartyl/asparaginy/proline hydroxylase domain-containing protein n=1 Tax=Steinernema hermaphroditum TaxID=289476 RepID=A0AA39GNJ6_9BILA|nr:hypothetical protein QR680_019286 [Steinernema hermaphroditum]
MWHTHQTSIRFLAGQRRMGLMLYAAFWITAPWAVFFGIFAYFELFPVFTPPARKPSSILTPHRRKKVLCTSANCVRCVKNETLLTHAKELLEANYTGTSDYERISNAIERRHEELLLQIDFDDSRPIWELEHFPANFQRDFDMLSLAVEAVKDDSQKAFDCPSMWSRNGIGENTWFIFPFLNQGIWQDEHCSVCPKIATVLYRLRNSLTDCVFGNAFISMIPSECAVAEHCGLTNARLRCHLGIEVPNDNGHCFMQVGGETFTWTNGACTVIDDSLPHSVSLKGCPEDRTVLVVDFWHPSLSEKERDCLKRIFSTDG